MDESANRVRPPHSCMNRTSTPSAWTASKAASATALTSSGPIRPGMEGGGRVCRHRYAGIGMTACLGGSSPGSTVGPERRKSSHTYLNAPKSGRGSAVAHARHLAGLTLPAVWRAPHHPVLRATHSVAGAPELRGDPGVVRVLVELGEPA